MNLSVSTIEKGVLGYLVDREKRQVLLVHHQPADRLVGFMAEPATKESAVQALDRVLEDGGLGHLEAQWVCLGHRDLPGPGGEPALHLESWVAFVDLHQVSWVQGMALHPLGGKSLVPLDPMAEEDLTHALRKLEQMPSPSPRTRRVLH
jgi:hypothetical protein